MDLLYELFSVAVLLLQQMHWGNMAIFSIALRSFITMYRLWVSYFSPISTRARKNRCENIKFQSFFAAAAFHSFALNKQLVKRQ